MMGRPLSSAIALPSPVVEPPPIATAQSPPSRLASARAARAVSIGTCITASAKMPAARSPRRPVASSARSRCSGKESTIAFPAPSRATSSASRSKLPTPKITREGSWVYVKLCIVVLDVCSPPHPGPLPVGEREGPAQREGEGVARVLLGLDHQLPVRVDLEAFE